LDAEGSFVAALASVDLRQEHRHDALERRLRGGAPEDVERLVVDLELLAAVEEDARERPIEVRRARSTPATIHRAPPHRARRSGPIGRPAAR